MFAGHWRNYGGRAKASWNHDIHKKNWHGVTAKSLKSDLRPSFGTEFILSAIYWTLGIQTSRTKLKLGTVRIVTFHSAYYLGPASRTFEFGSPFVYVTELRHRSTPEQCRAERTRAVTWPVTDGWTQRMGVLDSDRQWRSPTTAAGLIRWDQDWAHQHKISVNWDRSCHIE